MVTVQRVTPVTRDGGAARRQLGAVRGAPPAALPRGGGGRPPAALRRNRAGGAAPPVGVVCRFAVLTRGGLPAGFTVLDPFLVTARLGTIWWQTPGFRLWHQLTCQLSFWTRPVTPQEIRNCPNMHEPPTPSGISHFGFFI